MKKSSGNMMSVLVILNPRLVACIFAHDSTLHYILAHYCGNEVLHYPEGK
jgi:hypothetical protein